MTDPNYDAREIMRTHARLAEIRKAPLAVRRESREALRSTMCTEFGANVIAERIGWLLAGHYGYGERLIARRIADNRRMNRAAALTQLIAALEWLCPQDFARDAWKALTTKQKATLDRAVKAEIERYEQTQATEMQS